MRFFRRKKEPRRTTQQEPLGQPATVEVFGNRRYLGGQESSYLLPKDQREGDRLTFQHYYFKELLRSNYIAPLDPASVRDILDVGTGSGIWAREMAQEFPAAQVLGLDQESFQVLNLPPPLNYRFVRANILQGLPFEDNTFDFVHQRLLVGGIPANKWQSEIQELARVTRPGGWVELVEFPDYFHHYGPATKQTKQWWRALSEARGFDMDVIPMLDNFLMHANLKAEKKVIRVPIGYWGERAGDRLAKDLHAALLAMSGIYCSTLHLLPEHFERVINALPKEWDSFHTEFDIFLFTGVKQP